MSMATNLVFIIPVRHPQNAKDWEQLKANLLQTFASISAQTNATWRALVVANHGADLPPMPAGFEAVFVDLPPNPLYELGDDQEAYFEAVRLDKGRRILAGLFQAQTQGHIMLVDDDDFVHRDLASFSARHPTANGWYVRDGYLWNEGRLLYKYRDFSHLCGTSHIIRSDLFKLPARIEDASDAFVRRRLGSHRFIADDLRTEGTPLSPLPFAGAVYRVGHAGAHSQSQSILRKFFFGPEAPRNPLRLLRRLTNLRIFSSSGRAKFFGR
jgi:hypothetical protein